MLNITETCLGYESFVLNVLWYGTDVCMRKTRVCGTMDFSCRLV